MSAILLSKVNQSIQPSMRILVACIPMPFDRFISDLNQALGQYAEIVYDWSAFWERRGGFDAVHIHFPEYLTPELEAAMHSGLTKALLSQVEDRLQWWDSRCPILVTRHVFLPHRRQDALGQKLYELTYRHAAGVVHFSQICKDEYLSRYARLTEVRTQQQFIIPQHNFASLSNHVSRAVARRKFGIPEQAKVLLVFGGIQGENERKRILFAFRHLKAHKKILLVSSWPRRDFKKVPGLLLRILLRRIYKWYLDHQPRHRFPEQRVEDEDIQYFLNACDVVFIPRGRVNNSGNMILGFTFGRVVVGPKSGNIEAILCATGNPVFDPDDRRTMAPAVNKAFELAEQGLGERNREVALRDWDVKTIAQRYHAAFTKIISARTSGPPTS
jgi:glycosyltransferase involved in cell wall biosynthesis